MITSFTKTIAFVSYPLEKLLQRVVHPFAIRSILISWPIFIMAAFTSIFLGAGELAYIIADIHKCYIILISFLGGLVASRGK